MDMNVEEDVSGEEVGEGCKSIFCERGLINPHAPNLLLPNTHL